MEKNPLLNIPKLGFGLMRLPKLENGEIDLAQVCDMVDRFLDAGFTYFDTAYGYGGGASEIAAGKALVARHPRDKFFLATKLPAWDGVKTAEEAKAMFETSLKRTGAGYFDFYLLHNLGGNRTHYFDDFGLWDFVQEKKAAGLIKHVGFSFHDTADALDDLLSKHSEMEFVQLQINYADWENTSVQSRKCLEVAQKHGKPVVIMEPVKGGNLANPPERVMKVFSAADPDVSASSWAIRFAASQEGVVTVLSGMSDLSQMEDNLRTMRDFRPLSEDEFKTVDAARAAYNDIERIDCTGCAYCVKNCPAHVGIPAVFTAANMYKTYENLRLAKNNYRWNVVAQGSGRASACVRCGKCEEACPQHIHIRDELAAAAKIFDTDEGK